LTKNAENTTREWNVKRTGARRIKNDERHTLRIAIILKVTRNATYR